MNIIGLQDNYYFVHSPNIVYIEEDALKIDVRFYTSDLEFQSTLYPINAKFKLDVSQWAKLFLPAFNDQQFGLGLEGGEVEVDYCAEIGIDFTIYYESGLEYTDSFTKKFVHGVSQPGEKNYLPEGVHSIGEMVRVFAGYPFTINRLTENGYQRIAAEVEYLGDANEFATMHNLPEGPIYDIIKYPTQGNYIKWLDHNNNYSYWLFNERKVVSGTISNGNDTLIQVNDITTQSELRTPAGVEVSESIKLFSQIPSHYQDLIKSLFHSPEVYLYNLGYGEVADSPSAWSRVKVTSGYTFKSNTRNERIEIQISKVTQPLTMK